MDGATMIRALREIAPKLKIIAASGLATRGQSAEALELGVDGFLLKPFTAESLLARLREVLGSPDAPRS
jgi:DNA-binding response OmpR family regulator